METNNTIFQRSWKSESWKTKKTSRKQKKQKKKNNFPEVLVDRGVQPRVPKYCVFFFVFSRGFFKFFGFSPWGLSPKESPNIVFLFCVVFLFSRGICFFFLIFSDGASPQKSSQILFFCFFFVFYFFSSFFCFFFWFSPRGLSQESAISTLHRVRMLNQTMR